MINLEEIKGCESVAALLVRSGGLVCHTNIGNAYSKGMLIADGLGERVVNYALDRSLRACLDQRVQLVVSTQDVFVESDDFDKSINHLKKRKPAVMKEERTQMAAKQIDGFLYMSPANRVSWSRRC